MIDMDTVSFNSSNMENELHLADNLSSNSEMDSNHLATNTSTTAISSAYQRLTNTVNLSINGINLSTPASNSTDASPSSFTKKLEFFPKTLTTTSIVNLIKGGSGHSSSISNSSHLTSQVNPPNSSSNNLNVVNGFCSSSTSTIGKSPSAKSSTSTLIQSTAATPTSVKPSDNNNAANSDLYDSRNRDGGATVSPSSTTIDSSIYATSSINQMTSASTNTTINSSGSRMHENLEEREALLASSNNSSRKSSNDADDYTFEFHKKPLLKDIRNNNETFNISNTSTNNEDSSPNPNMSSYKYYSNILTNLSDSQLSLSKINSTNTNTATSVGTNPNYKNSTSSFSNSSMATTTTGKSETAEDFTKKIFKQTKLTSCNYAFEINAMAGTILSGREERNTAREDSAGDSESLAKSTGTSCLSNSPSLRFKSDILPRKTYKTTNTEWCGSQLSLGKLLIYQEIEMSHFKILSKF